jgi:hypothetical protein
MEAKVARTAGVAPALGVLEALTLYRVVRMERDVGVAPTYDDFADRCLAAWLIPRIGRKVDDGVFHPKK